MTWLNNIAYYKNIRSEIPNQELAKELVRSNSIEGIKEIASHLNNKNASVASDCIKVLYEAGYLNPELIKEQVNEFIGLLQSKNNRMVWGGMIALSTIAHLKADEIFKSIHIILDAINNGSVITVDAGIKTIVKVAMQNQQYKNFLLTHIFKVIEETKPAQFASRIEVALSAILLPDEQLIIDRIIEIKKSELTVSQQKKLRTIVTRHIKTKTKTI